MDRFHGILSLVLITIAVLIALIAVFVVSTAVGLVYLALVVLATLAVVYVYCAKCTARDHHCGHVLPGRLTRRLPARREGPYSGWEILATVLGLAVIFLFPQYWLWGNKALFAVFWLLTASALLEILFLVCRDCRNTNCIVCRRRQPS